MEDLNIKGMFKNKKWAPKLQKNKPIQTSKHAKIQIPMVRKNIHTNRQILPIHKNMQQMRI